MKNPPELITAQAILAMPGQLKTHELNPNAVRLIKSLGDAVGLTQIGVHLVTIMPGHDSTEYHRHHHEEEFVYILSGSGLAEIEDQVVPVAAGDFLGFPKNGVAHGMRNTGTQALVCLMGGQRLEQDVCDYPHQNKRLYTNGQTENWVNLQPTAQHSWLQNQVFLQTMADDHYFPRHLVEKGQQILIRLCHTIEREVPRGLNELYPLTHMAVIEFNELAMEFEDAGSEIETAAREAIGEAFASIASAYGFAADREELIANRDW